MLWRFQSFAVAEIEGADPAAVSPGVAVVPVTGSGCVPDVHGLHQQKDGWNSHRPCMVHPILTGHEDPAHFVHAINVAGQVSVPVVHRPVVRLESVVAASVQHLAALSTAAVECVQSIAVVQILVTVELHIAHVAAAGRADAVQLGPVDAFPESL